MAEYETSETTINFRGSSLVIAGYSGEYIFEGIRNRQSFYELDLLQVLSYLPIADEGLLIDVGANIGNHTLFMANRWANPLLAVEPEPRNFALLQRNVETNNFSDRVELRNCASWHTRSMLSISLPNQSNFGTFQVGESENGHIEALPLDEIVNGRRVSILKIDVEGSERNVLRGAAATIRESLPIVTAEVHSPEALEDVTQILAPLGFITVAIAGLSDNYIWAHPNNIGEESIDGLRARLELARARESARQRDSSAATVQRGLATIKDSMEKLSCSTSEILKQPEIQTLLSYAKYSSEILRSQEDLATKVDLTSNKVQDLANSFRTDLHAELGSRSTEILPEIKSLFGEARKSDIKEIEAILRLQIADDTKAEVEASRNAAEKLERSNRVLFAAFSRLASRLEKQTDGMWSSESAIAALGKLIARESDEDLNVDLSGAASEPRKLSGHAGKRNGKTRIGIASMPGRESGLREVVRRLIPQADEICVYLNGIVDMPAGLPVADNVTYYGGPDHGDRAKFLFLEGFDGYYLTCDDDIRYPAYYVEHILDGIERYGRTSVVGWHGSIFSDDFQSYYDPKYRRVLSFSTLRGQDTPVHLLGTGVCGFHTSTIDIKFDDFSYPNMADAFVAIAAKQQSVPMLVIKHGKGWATPIEPDAPSISNVSLGKAAGDGLDVASTVSSLIRSNAPWKFNEAQNEIARSDVSLAIIGRTDHDRWKKGGILKSAHLTVASLRRFGVDVQLEDIETGDPRNLRGANPKSIMIYVGDPERPEFNQVEDLVAHHAALGRSIAINMSINLKQSRYEAIAAKLLAWERQFGPRVKLMTFTEALFHIEELAPVRHLMTAIPKTLEFPASPGAEFASSSGIFLGDIAKLSDDYLMDYPAKDWISAIRGAVPEATLYGVQQYKPRYQVDLDIDVIWPFMKSDFSERLSNMRLMFTPIRYATFEMVPVEVASLGVPVLYTQMPQSLSEYLGLAGLRVSSPQELETVLPTLYRDPAVWRSQSIAGSRRAASADLTSTAGQMYLRIKQLNSLAIGRS